jgi:DNA-binding NarL/FixJ family response regulator
LVDNAAHTEAVRVLIVDDQRLVREGIASLLSIQPGIEVVGTAAHGEEALAIMPDLFPHVVLMDVRMPVMDGITATERIRTAFPACRVVMLTTFDDAAYIRASLDAGAAGYILKDIPSDDLAQAVRMAHKGIFQLDPAAVRQLTRHATSPAPPSASPPAEALHHSLTERERAVLRLVGQGATNREIAHQLFISEGTVKNHVSNILNRLNLRDRTQAAVYAAEHGLLDRGT